MSFKRFTGKILRGLCAGTVIAVFVSCATMKAGRMKYPVYVTNTSVIDLLPPENMDGTIDSLYMLNGKYGSNSFYIQAYVRANENGIFINLLNDFGTDMGSLTYTGVNLKFDSPVFPKNMKPQYIAADIQFAYYNADAVSGMLARNGLDFTCEKQADGKEIRRISDGKKCIEEITKSGQSVQIVNHLRGYQYNLAGAQQ